MPPLDLLVSKVHLVLMVDRVAEVLRVFLACLEKRDPGAILDCRAILVCKDLPDHQDNHSCLSLKRGKATHRQETMIKDQLQHAPRASQVSGALQAHMEDQALQDHLDKMVPRELQETEALRVQLVPQVHLGQEVVTAIQGPRVRLDIQAHVAHQERRELRD